MNKLWFKIVYCFKAVCRFLFALIRNGNECEICGKKVYKTILCKTCIETKFIGKVSSCELRNTDSIKANQLENPFIHKIEKLELKHINKVYVLYPYDLWNKDLLYKWKIDGERSLSPLFAKLIAGVLLKNNIKIIVPVPPRKGKVRENGWDQVEELSQFLEYNFGFKVLRLLERKSSIQQKKLKRDERFISSKKSYFLKSKKEIGRILGKDKLPGTVCLVDDVMTTGATIDYCGKVLREGGIKEIFALTLFIV